MSGRKFINEKLDRLEANRTHIYILPMIGWSLGRTYDGLINYKMLFLKNDDRVDEVDKVYMLVKFSGDRKYLLYEDELRKSDIYYDSYDPDKRHIMFVFDIPEKFKKEYDLFLKGKYSEFSEEYKQMIMNFHGIEKTRSVKEVLYKEEKAYLREEKEINKDYPAFPGDTYLKISREQEIGKWVLDPYSIMKEIYTSDLKVPNEEPNVDSNIPDLL